MTRTAGRAADARVEGPGRAVPEPLRTELESGFGADLSAVRIHPGEHRATRLNALAFTVGNHIAFAPGAWEPTHPAGAQVLAHEVAHVLQQRRGGPASPPLPGSAAERAAEVAADRVLAGGCAGPPVGTAVGAARLPAPGTPSIDAEIELLRDWLLANPDPSQERDLALERLGMLEDEARGGGPPSGATAPSGAGTTGAAEPASSPGVLGTLGGALLGEFEQDPTVAMVVVDTLVSFIPVVDQVADIRDIVAHLYWMTEGGESGKPLRWVGLGFSLIGAIPEIGTAIKGASKLVIKGGKEALSHADEILGLTRQLLPDGGDLRRALAWVHENWARWTAAGRALWTSVLTQVRDGLDRVPGALLSAKDRLLAAIAEVEQRSSEALTQAFDDILTAVDDGFRRLMHAMGIDPDALAHAAGPRPALAGAGAGGPPSPPNAVAMSGGAPGGGGGGGGHRPKTPTPAAGTVGLPPGVKGGSLRTKGLAVVNALPAEQRLLADKALRAMTPEDAGALLTELGRSNNPAALLEGLRRKQSELLDEATDEITDEITDEVADAAAEVAEVAGTGQVISKPPGPVNQEPGIQGDIGEARHQAEISPHAVRDINDVFDPETLRDLTDSLLSGRMTLGEFVDLLPPGGVGQFKLPTADGAHRIIDHVFRDGARVVFRESKNYRDLFELKEGTMRQLMRDLPYLRRFGDLRIEWRISARDLGASTRAELDALVVDYPGLFTYVLD